ncbi:MAG TPA: M1 family aminopeptidase [Candidatus Acidoferrales bacterium]|nr:M1 family aminopeptidase [Candidatus Acidoferrales bacterium]
MRVTTVLAIGILSVAQAIGEGAADKPAEALYLQLRQVGLDPRRVYQVRDASLDRSAVHITLADGTIAFTQDVMGRITGAFFEGDGEVLLTPPNDVERRSMSLFTGMAILEERFATAYFRFNDDVADELRPDLRATDNAQGFVERWGTTAQNLAETDALRMLITFSRMLPVKNHAFSQEQDQAQTTGIEDRFLHARLQGTKLGVFDILFDSRSSEQVAVGQDRTAANGAAYYDIWTSFSPATAGTASTKTSGTERLENQRPKGDPVLIRRFAIKTEVQPPTQVRARCRLQLEAKESGERALLFELSRFLKVENVTLDGSPVEFIHNPALEGSQLARRGNDSVAVIMPEPLRAGQKIELEFNYGGEVLAEAGKGLLYVGARGTWYPNRGMAMADFDLEFSYPEGWTLVATGKPVPSSPAEAAKTQGVETSHWVSGRPIPVAGFNLGKYKVAKTQAGDVAVETYATQAVERGFPALRIEQTEPIFTNRPQPELHPVPQMTVPSRPSPARNEVTVGEEAARAIRYYAERFGPYPYSRLALTQMPGSESQGWPSLVFLSSYAFLTVEEREQLHLSPSQILLQQSLPAHETAHQWWGDLVGWKGYRDQWLSEGLANYCALMMLQERNPEGFRQIMEKYRQDLVVTNKDGLAPKDAGPVTLGVRLLSSRFPEGYEAISYGRATWLFHMLRTMLKDAALKDTAAEPGREKAGRSAADEPFVQALHRLRQRYEGRAISTQELLDVFAEDLSASLRYQGRNSLDWFLDGWINGTSLPRLELRVVKFTPQKTETVVSGTILQKDAPVDLVTSVPVYAFTTGKQPVLLGRVFADGEETSFRLMAPLGIHKIVLDPNETVLTAPK